MGISMSTIWLLLLWMLMVRGDEQISNENAILNYITKRQKPLERVGSGKTTLALMLTGGELYRKKDINAARYVFTDKDNVIGNGSIKTPKTVVPNLMSNKDDSHDYYIDCPGFIRSDDRNVDYIFEKNLIFQKLYHSAKELNFIFTVKYDEDENKFIGKIDKLAERIKDIFNYLARYEKSIAIVVTQYPFNTDPYNETTIRSWFSRVSGFQDRASMKIGYFIEPHKEQSERKLGAANRNALFENVIVKLPYVLTQRNAFRCPIKNSDKEFLNFMEKITGVIKKNFGKIVEGIKDFISQEESRFSMCLNKSIEITNKISSELSKLTSHDPVVLKFTNAIYKLGIRIRGDVLQKSIQYFEFIQHLRVPESRKSFAVPDEITALIAHLIEHVRHSQNCNTVLVSLRQYFDDQRLFARSNLNEAAAIRDGINYLYNSIGRFTNFPAIQSNITYFYQNNKTSPHHIQKLKLLDLLLQQSIEPPVFHCSDDRTYFLVTGYNILMEDVAKDNCFNEAKTIHIFALNKFFSETHIKRSNGNVDLTIISPTWETKGTAFELKLDHNDSEYSEFVGIGKTMVFPTSIIHPENKVAATTGNLTI